MKRHTIKIRTLIILLGIVMISCEFLAYYLLNDLKIPMVIAVILNIILLHIYLDASLSYLSCFLHSSLITLFGTGCTLFIYYNQTGNLLVYDKNLPFLLLLNWLVPTLYCIFRDLTDHGPRFVCFRSFFIRNSTFFGIYYFILFVKVFFLTPTVFPDSLSQASNPFIPFLATAAYIEDVIYSGHPLLPLLWYIAKSLLYFLPVGFYSALLLRKAPKIYSFLFPLLFPLIAESLHLLNGGILIMDVYLWKLIGILLGIVLYRMLNGLSNHLIKCDFLTERNNYTFFNLYY